MNELPPGVIELRPKTNRSSKRKPAPNWMRDACFDDKGALVPNLASAMTALRNVPQISQCFALDEMLCAPVLVEPLPAPKGRNQAPDEILPRAVRDDDVTQLQEWFVKVLT
jgi:hypothetical protein